jgi:hypothetical protein
MSRRIPRRVVALLPLALLAAAALLAVAVAHAPLPFSAYDPGPQGSTEAASHLASLGLKARDLHTDLHALAELPSDPPALLVVQGLAAPPTRGDVAALDQFVARGGRVLVADDAGLADALSQPYGVSSGRFPVSDLRFSQNASILPLRLHLDGQEAPVHAVGPVLLVVGPDAQGAVVGTTQDSAFLDLDHDGALGLKDQVGPFPVAFETPANAHGGRYLFVSAAGLLQNQRGDAASATELDPLFQHLLGRDGTVVFDERGKEPSPLASAASGMQGAAQAAAAQPLGLALASAALAWAAVAAARRCPPPMPLAHAHRPDLDATPPGVLRGLRTSRTASPAPTRAPTRTLPESQPA